MTILSGCFFDKYNISTMRNFVPSNYKVKTYEIIVKPSQFMGYRSKGIIRSVFATYVSTSSTVSLYAAEFQSTFEMHDLWYAFAKKESGTWNALNSSLWWFSGGLKTSKYLAWYTHYTIFILESEDPSSLYPIKDQVQNFMSVFGGANN